jgi:hypothetical protein
VGWVFEDGTSEAHLIAPASNWTDWDEEAEAIHRIDRAMLAAEGSPVDRVRKPNGRGASDHALYASAPSWDGKWLSALLRAAGLPRHSLRLKDTEEARQEVIAELVGDVVPPEELDATVSELLAQAAAFGKGLTAPIARSPMPSRSAGSSRRLAA